MKVDQSAKSNPRTTILGFGPRLFEMLDGWAIQELGKIDPAADLKLFHEDPALGTVRVDKATVADVLSFVEGWRAPTTS
jgi:hypothetical protein